MSPSLPLSVIWVDDDTLYLGHCLAQINTLKPMFDITVAFSYEEALRLFRERAFDVAVVDLELQEGAKNGKDLIREITRLHPQLEIIVVTAYDDAANIVACMKMGAGDFAAKTAGVAEIHFRILNAEQRRLKKLQYNDYWETKRPYEEVVAVSPMMQSVLKHTVKSARNLEINILLRGETGVGKEVMANLINAEGGKSRPFVAVNCAAIPEALLESVMFGHERGAFSGAITSKVGKFEIAHEGDIFLDEVSTLNPAMQAKLLRVLETKQVERLGSNKSHSSNFRVIAATNEPLEALVQSGRFRQDLYERLAGIEITIPPLRDHKEDIIPLVQRILKGQQRGLFKITNECEKLFLLYHWPGNIRQLKQVVLAMTTLADSEVLSPALLPRKIIEYLSQKQETASSGDEANADIFNCSLPLRNGWQSTEIACFRTYIQSAVGFLGRSISLRSLAEFAQIPRSTMGDKLKAADINLKDL